MLNAFRHQRSWRTKGCNCSRRGTGCSTPFGIRDHGGRREHGQATHPHVLNAFRHQRSWRQPDTCQRREDSPGCSTPFGIRDHGGPSCKRRRIKTVVLNAFRHQRSWRPPAPSPSSPPSCVLNAFRHQRSWRTDRPLTSTTLYSCSTPFGIRDHGGHETPFAPDFIVGAQRLSASEIMAAAPGFPVYSIIACSTPFGIRDHGGYLIRPGTMHFCACSTPFGIRDHGGAARFSPAHLSPVLNAFRHQRSWRIPTIA